jgi:RNA polymerase sigma factor (sigma-70 family)
MSESRKLLADYVEKGSEAAFRELVARYINLVYSTALRLMGGDTQLAEDVTQTVFVHLSQRARRLSGAVMLGGWLHRDACYVASKTLRSERRRRHREQQAVLMNSVQDHSRANLDQVAPVLDEAINLLGEADRSAILLRFFEQRDFRAVGAVLGSNEDAARMRVNRALEKLQTLLKRRGVALSALTLGTVLSTEAVTVAPAGLAGTVALAALATGAAGAGTIATFFQLMTMTKLKAGILGTVVLAAVATPSALLYQSQTKLRQENMSLRQQVDSLAQVAAENERLSNLVMQAQSRAATPRNDLNELLKLRGEVGSLRRQLAEATRLPAKAASVPSRNETGITPEEERKLIGIAKLNYTKQWMLAFHFFANDNEGQSPTNFDQALPYLSNDAKVEANLKPGEFLPGTPKYGLTPEHYEIVYQGSLNGLSNPQNIIVVREKEPWRTEDGSWMRTYAFADGHAEIHKATDGNFAPWEAQHMVAANAPGQGP